MTKVIKSDADYETALAEIGRLLDNEIAPGTPDADRLELLTLLVREYESSLFPIGVPGPIEAIRFRMEQENLSQRDLVPLIGSRSKVSEVLSGRRPLTLSMMRALHSGLGIPAKVLLQGREAAHFEESPIQWDKFPVREMVTRGWIEEKITDYRSPAEDVVRRFFSQLGPTQPAFALLRQSQHVRSGRKMDEYALIAWAVRAMILANGNPPVAKYKEGAVDLDFMKELARFSFFEEGPRLAQEFLGKYGIAFVIVPHLPRTYLDGAAIMAKNERPIVALTLRYDRVDNFWFCLMHELAHVALHLGKDTTKFFDDLDAGSQGDQREDAADRLAGEALIPDETWRKSPVSDWPAPEAVRDLACELRIHPAIVAGRYRHMHRSYRVLNQFVGHGQVRRVFRGVKWD